MYFHKFLPQTQNYISLVLRTYRHIFSWTLIYGTSWRAAGRGWRRGQGIGREEGEGWGVGAKERGGDETQEGVRRLGCKELREVKVEAGGVSEIYIRKKNSPDPWVLWGYLRKWTCDCSTWVTEARPSLCLFCNEKKVHESPIAGQLSIKSTAFLIDPKCMDN